MLMLFFTLHINALSADSLPGSAALDSSAVIAESFSNEEETMNRVYLRLIYGYWFLRA